MSKTHPVATVSKNLHGQAVVIEVFRAQPAGFRGNWSCQNILKSGGSGGVGETIEQAIAMNELNAAVGIRSYFKEHNNTDAKD